MLAELALSDAALVGKDRAAILFHYAGALRANSEFRRAEVRARPSAQPGTSDSLPILPLAGQPWPPLRRAAPRDLWPVGRAAALNRRCYATASAAHRAST